MFYKQEMRIALQKKSESTSVHIFNPIFTIPNFLMSKKVNKLNVYLLGNRVLDLHFITKTLAKKNVMKYIFCLLYLSNKL